MFECIKTLFRKKKDILPYKSLYKNKHKDITADIIKEINLHRKNKLTECTNPLVFDQAYEHSKWMSDTGNFSHKNFNLRNVAITENTKFKWIGENLARGYSEPKKLVHAWNESKGHREMMLNETYREVSIAKYNEYITAIFLK